MRILPFIGRQAQISRAHISHSILALSFLLWNLVENLFELRNAGQSIKQEIMDRCGVAEARINQMLALPRQIAIELNEASTEWINRSIQSMVRVFTNGIELVGKLLQFAFNTFYSVIRCLAEAVIDSGLALLAQYSKQIVDFFNQTLQGMAGVANQVSGGLNQAIGAVSSFFTGKSPDQPIPLVTIGDLPNEVEEGLKSLAVFNLSFVDDQLNRWLMEPFRLATEALTNEGRKLEIQNLSVLSVDSISVMSVQICDREKQTIFGQDLTFVDLMNATLRQMILICIGLVCGAIVLVIINRQLTVRWRYDRLAERMDGMRELLAARPGVLLTGDNLPVVNYELNYPTRARFTRWMSGCSGHSLLVAMDPTHADYQSTVRRHWVADYIAHTPSLIMMVTGVLGLLLCWLQLQSIHNVRSTVVPQIQRDFSDMADQMVAMVNEKILLNTADFINNTNMALTMVQDDVNNGLFGPLKDTVGAINGTMNNVIDDVIKFLKETLHLDVLGPLIDRLMNCLIRFRLKGLEEIMKIIMNMGLNLPRINPDKFKVSETGVQQDLLELNHYLFGENLDGRGGKVGFVLGKLEQRVYRQILFYIIAILVGSTIAWQGLLAYLYMKSHNLPKAAEFDLPLHSIDEEEKPHNKH